MKCNLTDGGIGVMLMLRSPELPEGTVVDAMVSHLDLYPTICEVLGLEAPEWIEGRSLLPVVAGTSERVHDAVFASVNHHSETEPMRSVRTDRYKYIRRWDQSGHPVLENCNDGESKSYWVAHGWGEEPVAQEELYDLVFDPNERNNLAPDERSAGVLADMRRRLEEWMSRTDDPLLGGSIPPGPSIA
jgi:arylsulfatase A-like enzyme